MSVPENRRILLVDDLPSIHEDFRKILCPPAETAELDAAEAILFGPPTGKASSIRFEMDSAYQGAEGLEKVRVSLLAGLPFAMAFVDMRMPPGWDGVETAERLWQVDPRLQIVFLLHRLFRHLLAGRTDPTRRSRSAAHPQKTI
jgi:two-component system, NtrC family, sensor kinase